MNEARTMINMFLMGRMFSRRNIYNSKRRADFPYAYVFACINICYRAWATDGPRLGGCDPSVAHTQQNVYNRIRLLEGNTLLRKYGFFGAMDITFHSVKL